MFFSIFLLALAVLVFVFAWYRRAVRPTHAGGIVYKTGENNRLLLLTTSATNKNKWVLPKGRIEKNEAPEFAATREVMEETGIKAIAVKKAGTVSYTRKNKRIIVVYFLMEFQQSYDTATEGRQVLWVSKDEATKRLERTEVKELLGKLAI